MNRIRTIISIVMGIGVVAACNLVKDDPIGKWDDIIQLSTKNVELSSSVDSAVVTTQGSWWWIASISYNDSTYQYYNRSDINMEADKYKIIEKDFTLERRDKNTLYIQMEKNESGNSRDMSIVLEAGNYFDYLRINQQAN